MYNYMPPMLGPVIIIIYNNDCQCESTMYSYVPPMLGPVIIIMYNNDCQCESTMYSYMPPMLGPVIIHRLCFPMLQSLATNEEVCRADTIGWNPWLTLNTLLLLTTTGLQNP